MATHKHHRKHRKHHKKMHGSGFFDTLKKGLNFVKDNGLLSKGLNVASTVAGALGKQGIADKLNTAGNYAQAFGAGRKRHRKKQIHGPRLRKYKTANPTLQAEVMDFDGNNKLFGTGRRRHRKKHMKGGNFFDDLIGGIGKVAETALPIAAHVLPMLGVGKHHHGGSLKLAGMGLGLAGGAHMQNYSGANSYHLGHHMPSYRRNDNHLRGSGFLSRVNRSHGKMALV
jgi:hypothetical protein